MSNCIRRHADQGDFLFKDAVEPVKEGIEVQVYELATRFELDAQMLRALYGQPVKLSKKQAKKRAPQPPLPDCVSSDASRSHPCGSYIITDSTDRPGGRLPCVDAAMKLGWRRAPTLRSSRSSPSSSRRTSRQLSKEATETTADSSVMDTIHETVEGTNEGKGLWSWALGTTVVLGGIFLLVRAVRRR